ncbi:phage major capsid protein, P2 family [Serratia fonticola]|nr:phage major capsid protein, P2 family [Serratia fonticola]
MNYESVNEVYVVEDYECCAMIENIEVMPANAKAPVETPVEGELPK